MGLANVWGARKWSKRRAILLLNLTTAGVWVNVAGCCWAQRRLSKMTPSFAKSQVYQENLISRSFRRSIGYKWLRFIQLFCSCSVDGLVLLGIQITWLRGAIFLESMDCTDDLPSSLTWCSWGLGRYVRLEPVIKGRRAFVRNRRAYFRARAYLK